MPWNSRRCAGRVQSGAEPEPEVRHWRCTAARNGVMRAGIPHPDEMENGRVGNMRLRSIGEREQNKNERKCTVERRLNLGDDVRKSGAWRRVSVAVFCLHQPQRPLDLLPTF